MILKQVMRVYPFGTRNEEIEVSIPSLVHWQGSSPITLLDTVLVSVQRWTVLPDE